MTNAKSCVSCGLGDALFFFDTRTLTVEYRHLSCDVPGLSGWECRGCGDIEFAGDSAIYYAEAGDRLLAAFSEN